MAYQMFSVIHFQIVACFDASPPSKKNKNMKRRAQKSNIYFYGSHYEPIHFCDLARRRLVLQDPPPFDILFYFLLYLSHTFSFISSVAQQVSTYLILPPSPHLSHLSLSLLPPVPPRSRGDLSPASEEF